MSYQTARLNFIEVSVTLSAVDKFLKLMFDSSFNQFCNLKSVAFV